MKTILLIDMPEHCFECPCCDKEYGCCDLTNSWKCDVDNRAADCPLIPLTKYEEARINEILKERGENECEQQDMIAADAKNKEKTGTWHEEIETLPWKTVEVAVCSECGESYPLEYEYDSIEEFRLSWRYCPNCGTHMVNK